jgi:protein involved in polysaccharide export with SLBB domain
MERSVTMVTRTVTVMASLVLAVPALASGQTPLGPTRLEIDRAELTGLLAQYDTVAMSTAYSDVLRDEVRSHAAAIQERLSAGDFQVGDQLALLIEGAGAAQWDTLMVEAGPLIDVPILGPILLHGVLRSELETHLEAEIGRFLQTPRVQARALIRVSVSGGIGRPGFYAIPTNLRLSDVVAWAGGAQGGADPGQIRVERGCLLVWVATASAVTSLWSPTTVP